MNYDLVVSQSIDINASPEKVWNALTDPEIIKEYLFGTHTTTDWMVGSPITFKGEYNGQTYTDKGMILENTPLEQISYSYWSTFYGTEDKPENYSTVTYTLKPKENGHTEFTWTQKGYANEAGYEHSKTGMDAFLKQIKTIIER